MIASIVERDRDYIKTDRALDILGMPLQVVECGSGEALLLLPGYCLGTTTVAGVAAQANLNQNQCCITRAHDQINLATSAAIVGGDKGQAMLLQKVAYSLLGLLTDSGGIGWFLFQYAGNEQRKIELVTGVLYIVATPIGNLGDFSMRGQQVLAEVDLILAEDTRHSRRLLDHFGIETPLRSMHEHNEERRVEPLVQRMVQGESIAQISDAGTPLVSDPGFLLARGARDAGVTVTAVPGASAPITALLLSGLPVNRFSFEGFLPSRATAREQFLQALVSEIRTMIFFESPRRVVDALHSMRRVFGGERVASVARELTKLHESVHTAPLDGLIEWVESDTDRQRGEFVLLVEGAGRPERGQELEEGYRIVRILARELPPRKAAALAAEITGVRKNQLYRSLVE